MSCELWQAVLARTIADALLGVANEASRAIRVRVCVEARNYLTKPSHDLAEVCALANMDMDSVIERMCAQIAKLPSPEELAENPRARVATLTKAKANSRCRDVPFKDREFTINGEVKTASEWCKRTGISLKVARTRLQRLGSRRRIFPHGGAGPGGASGKGPPGPIREHSRVEPPRVVAQAMTG